jgi:hypothetical protein
MVMSIGVRPVLERPICHGALDDKLRQRTHIGIIGIGNEGSRRHDAPGRMTHPDQRFGAHQHHLAQVDLRLIPELEPIVRHRLLDVDVEGGRVRDRQKRRKIFIEIAVTKRRGERRQHRETDLLAEFLKSHQRGRGASAEQHHPAGETCCHHHLQRLGDFTFGLEQAQHHQIRLKVRQRFGEFREPPAFTGDESELLQGIRQEPSDMRFGVDHADARNCAPTPELHRVVPGEAHCVHEIPRLREGPAARS